MLLPDAQNNLIFEKNPQPMWIYDPGSLRFLAVNEAAVRLYGYSQSEFALLSLRCISVVEDKSTLCDVFGKKDHRQSYEGEWIHRIKDGSVINVQIASSVIDFAGQTTILSVITDITTNKRTEKALRDSNALYRTLVENLPVSIFLKDNQGVFTFVNQGMSHALERDVRSIVGKTDYDFFPPALAAKYRRDDLRVIETGEVFEDIEEHCTARGEKKYVQVIKSPLRDSAGQPIGIQGAFLDVTERKRIEEERDQFFEVSRDMLCIAGFDGYFKRINPAFEEALGYTIEELMESPSLDFVHEDDRDKTMRETRNITEGICSAEFVNRYRCKDGSYRTIQWKSTSDLGKQLIFAVARDITELRLAEEERQKLFRERESLYGRLQLMLEHMPIGCIMNDQDFRFTYWNPAAERIFGYKQSEVRGQLPFGVITPTSAQEVVKNIFRELAGGGAPISLTAENITKDGRTIVCEWNNMAVHASGGTFLGIISMCQDVTDRHRAEEALKQSEKDYHSLFEHAHDALIIFDPEGEQILDANQKACQLYGYSREELLSMSIEELSRDVALGKERIYQTLNNSDYISFETVQYRKDGTEMFLEINATRVNYKGRAAIKSNNRDITEKKKAERALHDSEELLRSIVTSTPIVVFALDLKGTFKLSEGKGLEKLNLKPGEVVGKSVYEVYQSFPQILADVNRALGGEIVNSTVSVGENVFESWYSPLKDQQGEIVGTIGVSTDVSLKAQAEQKLREKEEQLRQSQKMEAVGQLAGGVAHDFNNLLTVINGYSDLLAKNLHRDDPRSRNVEEIIKAAERATSLTRQLLAFSRKQVLQPTVLNLNDIVANVDQMLRRLLGEWVELKTILEPELGAIKADRGQLEQIIVNLAVNARDAMPGGGTLTIETRNVLMEDFANVRRVDFKPGPYVLLSVRDSGVGMSLEVKEHIFEPFFTTKELGKGTGLGLSTVYGIVKQSGGHVYVYSEIGLGTTFKIYLPCVETDQPQISPSPLPIAATTGTETILVVEDEEIVRKLACEILRCNGYQVIDARNGEEALEICLNQQVKIDLMMTDMIMPQLGGRELAERVRPVRPQLKILFTSGYTDDDVFHHNVGEEEAAFIEKPFAPDALAHKVRQVLDATQV